MADRTLGDVFLRVRTKTDSREVRSEVDRGVKGAKLGGIGDREGQVFSQGLIDGLNKKLKSSDIKAFGSRWQALITAALAIGPAAVPAAAVLGAGIISVGAAAASAGAALGVFGVVTGVAFKEVQTNAKKVSDLHDKIRLLNEEIRIAPKGSELEKSLIKSQAKATVELQARLNLLPGPLRAAVVGFQKAKDSAQDFVNVNKPTVYTFLAKAFDLVAKALPHFQPLFDAGARGANSFLKAISGFINGGGLDKVISYMSRRAGPAISAFMHIFGSLASGVEGISRAFGGSGQGVLDFLTKMADKFATFGQGLESSGGFSKFIAFLQDNGPDVVKSLKDIAVAAIDIAKATTPLAPITFAVAEGLSKIITALPQPVLTALIGSFIAFSLGMRVAGQVAPILKFGMEGVNGAFKLAGKAALGTRIQLGLLAIQQKIAAAATIAYNATLNAIKFAQEAWAGSLLRTRVQLVLIRVQTALVAAGQKIAAAATTLWAGAQKFLNLAFLTSPIGLIVIGIVALIAIIVIVATKTDFFQKLWKVAWGGIKDAFNAVFNFIKRNWPLILAILTGPIGAVVIIITRHWGEIKDAFDRGRRAIVGIFLDMVGNILDAAVRMLGWVPGIGGKLKKARDEFNTFRNNVNSALGGIKDHSVTVSATTLIKSGVARADAIGDALHRAAGGPVFGAGSSTSDSIPAMLSNGEHVWSADEVAGAGGHVQVAAMRKAAVAGFAAGGPVDLSVRARTSGLPQLRAGINNFAKEVDAAAAAALQKQLRDMAASGQAFGGSAPAAAGGNVGLGRVIAAQHGFTGAQFNALYNLWQGESGWNNNAQNPTSTAYGIAQFLNSTWGGVGIAKTSNPARQIEAGLRYIQSSYGTPANAYGKWLARSPHWYGKGGVITEPIAGIGLRSGDAYGFGERGPETITPGTGTGRSGPLLHVEKMYVNDRLDVDEIAYRINFMERQGGFT